MTEVDWRIKGESLTNCNCDPGCPCQFNSLPTHGDCRAVVGIHVAEGHFGDVDLAGVTFGVLVAWPGAIHEGNGEAQPIIDEKTTPEQREAILAIMAGEHTDPGATVFNVFAATFETMHDPIIAPIAFKSDKESRTGHMSIADVVDVSCEPLRNPLTGGEHRARIDIPKGFEYSIAEVAAGTSKTGEKANINLEWNNGHAHLIDLHWTQHGVVH